MSGDHKRIMAGTVGLVVSAITVVVLRSLRTDREKTLVVMADAEKELSKSLHAIENCVQRMRKNAGENFDEAPQKHLETMLDDIEHVTADLVRLSDIVRKEIAN